MIEYFRCFREIQKHRRRVRKYCFKAGQYKLGLLHDIDKLKPSYIKAIADYENAKEPYYKEKYEPAYDLAQYIHDSRSTHHLDFWLTKLNTRKNKPMKIPYNYIIEIICNWIAIDQLERPGTWSKEEPLNYYQIYRDSVIVSPRTDKVMTYLLCQYRDLSEPAFFNLLRHPELSKVLTNYLENKD